MSFRKSIKITHKKPYKNYKKLHGKENDSILAIQSNHNLRTYNERASAFASKGSLTIEAAVIIPLFFFAILCFACALEMMSTKIWMRSALYSAGREISQQAYTIPIVTGYSVKSRVVKYAGEERIENSMIERGTKGIDCSKTTYQQTKKEFHLSMEYCMSLPTTFFPLPPVECKETLLVKGWTGLAEGEKEEADTVVYVTKTGTVYHKDMFCKYLVSSVRTITREELAEARNASGGIYYLCEVCGDLADNTGRIYITEYGDRYHVSIACNALKKVVYAVPYKEVSDREGCSKCVK